MQPQPIATDVARSMYLCVCLYVGHNRELCKMAELIEMPFGVSVPHGSNGPCLRWEGSDLSWKRAILREHVGLDQIAFCFFFSLLLFLVFVTAAFAGVIII